jgi:hypothetical protein
MSNYTWRFQRDLKILYRQCDIEASKSDLWFETTSGSFLEGIGNNDEEYAIF